MYSTGRNVGLLAACQAMLFTNNTTLVAINGLAGLALTPVKALATLLLDPGQRDRHHARFAPHEARRPAAWPDPGRVLGHRRGAALRRGDGAAELLAALLRHAGVGRLQRLRPVLPLCRRRRRERRFPAYVDLAGAPRRAC